MPLSRSTAVAILVGSALGAGAALLGLGRGDAARGSQAEYAARQPFPPLNDIESASASKQLEAAAAPSLEAEPASSTRSAPAPTASAQAVPRATDAQLFELVPSPHEQPIRTEAEFKQAERQCILNDADACVRVADAYERGTPVDGNGGQARAFSRVAKKLYLQNCERRDADACYALARMAREGDNMPQDPRNAASLLKRVRTLCTYRSANVCTRLKHAGSLVGR